MSNNYKRFAEIVGLLFILAFSVQADAKTKERVYNLPIDEVWAACVDAASNNFVLLHSEKESHVLTFETGHSFTSNGFSVGVSVKEIGKDKVRVTLNPQKKAQLFAWGAGDRIADKYFNAVEVSFSGDPKKVVK